MDNESMKNILETSISDSERRITALLKKKDRMEKDLLKLVGPTDPFNIMLIETQYAIWKANNTIIANARMFRDQTIEELKVFIENQKRDKE